MKPNLVILGGDHASTKMVYHHLRERFPIAGVILEEPVPRSTFLRRRIKHCGLLSVFGQGLFSIVASTLLQRAAASRLRAIKTQYGLSDAPIPEQLVIRVPSVNDASVPAHLARLAPTHVIVWGTRIIGKKVLASIAAPFINIHAGITPMYRGSHGGYWALWNNDKAHCGVTVHIVDEGIDTGGVVAQAMIDPQPGDSFATYPMLQLAKGLDLLALALAGEALPKAQPPAGASKVWYHPTLWGYLWARYRRSVK